MEGQAESCVSLNKMHTSNAQCKSSLSRFMSVYISLFLFTTFFLIKEKKKAHLKLALFQRGDSKPPDFFSSFCTQMSENTTSGICPQASSGDEIKFLQKGY